MRGSNSDSVQRSYLSISHNARRSGCRKKSRNLKRIAVLCHHLLKKSPPSKLVVALPALKKSMPSMTSKLDMAVPHKEDSRLSIASKQ